MIYLTNLDGNVKLEFDFLKDFSDDEAAGVLRNGEYITNPTAHNINHYTHEGSNYLESKNMNG